jgi:phytoene dehydrogenase-like protein
MMKKLIVIGAGFAGLSTALYAREKGYDVTVYERHSLPGGMCASWVRKGYVFEGCFHYIKLLGASRMSVFFDTWKRLGAFDGPGLLRSAVVEVFRDRAGRTLSFYVDPRRLEAELTRLSPGDAMPIRELCAAIRSCRWFTRRAGLNPVWAARKIVNILKSIPFLNKYGDLSLEEYSSAFADPLLRRAVSTLFGHGEISCVQLPMFLGMYVGSGVAYPSGGSLGLAKAAATKVEQAGGRIVYGAEVRKIAVEGGRAVGVELADGSRAGADAVVAACDAHETLYGLLGGAYSGEEDAKAFREAPLYEAYLQVSLGVARRFDDLPSAIRVETDAPFEVADAVRDELWIANYSFDPAAAPPGHASIVVLYASSYDWWDALGYRSERYKAEKRRALEATIARLETLFPGIGALIEATDVATPLTTWRYTANYKSALGFMVTKDYVKELRHPRFSVPGIKGLYRTGQWVVGMGVPNAALGGKRVVEAMLRDDRRER